MKFIGSLLTCLLTNFVFAQTLKVNNGIDTIFLGAYNDIRIQTDLPNITLKCEAVNLRRLAEHYYVLKVCDSTVDSVVLMMITKGKVTAVKTFCFRVTKAPNPVAYLEFRHYPYGVRAILENGVDLPFVVKEYKLEIIQKTGSHSVYLNHGSQLEWKAYQAVRELQDGDTFRIIDLTAQTECEPTIRHLKPSKYYTIEK